MTFDPQTIEHLGVKMYSHVPNAIAELIANSYDADANFVKINLYNDDKRIEVIDDGIGMDFNEINEKFLRIGRNRRKEGAGTSPSGNRKVTGKKGLGKLALFGIGDTIDIITTRKGSEEKIIVTLDWKALKSTGGGEYKPQYRIEMGEKNLQGTTIILKNLRRKSPFDKKGLAVSLSKLFNLFDKEFECFISLDGDEPFEINNELKIENIDQQFKFEFPNILEKVEREFEFKDQISGKVISATKPLKPGLRGITLFANGRLVNEPEFFGIPESSHVFSYLTGWLNVDFIDDMDEDLISTNRQSLNWDLTYTEELRKFLRDALRIVERKWRDRRREENEKTITRESEVDIKNWYNALPEEILSDVRPIVKTIIDDSELPSESQATIVKKVHSLVPEYPYYHWRHLHEEVQDASLPGYQKRDYYKAFIETVKRYINAVKSKSGSKNLSDASMMGEVFGEDKPLSVTSKFKKLNGDNFSSQTKENIEEGQKFLSMGIVKGARNPVFHEEVNDLRESGLFSEKDCLDALSLLSHLFKRLHDVK